MRLALILREGNAPLPIKAKHRHSYLSERLRLDHIERELGRELLAPRLQSMAALATGVKMDTKVMLDRYNILLKEMLACLPLYLAPAPVPVSDNSEQALVERYKRRREELDELARTTQL